MPNPALSLLSDENLPEWDLKDLYTSLNDPKIKDDLKASSEQAMVFAGAYQGAFLKPEWEPAYLLQAIKDYELIQELLGRLISFSGLMYYKNLNDPTVQQFHQKVQEQVTLVGGQLIFFNLEINKIPENLLQDAFAQNTELQRYQPWLKRVRQFLPHQLSDELEKLFLEKSLTASHAWNRLYDETLASMRFKLGDQELNLSQITDLLSHPEREKRQSAALSLSHSLKEKISLFTLVINTLAKDKEIEDTWRHYNDPTSERHLINQVEPEVIDSLVKAVKGSYSRLSHRYYALKAKLLGLDHLEYWDRNAPLADVNEQPISWLQARKIVLTAYEEFSPVMAAIGQQFFDRYWIDVPPKDGKTSGAFSHATIPSVHPYILLNYQGKTRDVMTLAHELGHGIHQVLAAKQGILLSETPLTLAETASVFGEMLIFQSLLKNASDPLQRRRLLAAKIDDMLSTVVRQIAFYEFEKQVHEKRRQGELSFAELGQTWLQTQKEALGPAVNIDPVVCTYWAYVSHFIHSPFYVYAYAFGDCLVNSLYAVYQKKPEGFADLYLNLLSAGGSKRYDELLLTFGLRSDHPDFWDQGLTMISDFIDQLEALVNG